MSSSGRPRSNSTSSRSSRPPTFHSVVEEVLSDGELASRGLHAASAAVLQGTHAAQGVDRQIEDAYFPDSQATPRVRKWKGVVHEVLDDLEHVGHEAGWAGNQLGKATRFGRNVESDFNAEYGHSSESEEEEKRSLSSARQQSGQIPLPGAHSLPASRLDARSKSTPPPATTTSRTSGFGHTAEPRSETDKDALTPDEKDKELIGKISSFRDLDDFENVIDQAQKLIDTATSSLGELQFRRQQHIVPYASTITAQAVDFKSAAEKQYWLSQPTNTNPSATPSDTTMIDAKWMASLITTSARQLKKADAGLQLIETKSPLKKGNDALGLTAEERVEFGKDIDLLQETFRQAADRVIDLARQEKAQLKAGMGSKWLEMWIKSRNPSWSDKEISKAVAEANAKVEKGLSVASLDLESIVARRIFQHPFLEIKRVLDTVLKRLASRTAAVQQPPVAGGFFSRFQRKARPDQIGAVRTMMDIGRNKPRKAGRHRASAQYAVGHDDAEKKRLMSEYEPGLAGDGQGGPVKYEAAINDDDLLDWSGKPKKDRYGRLVGPDGNVVTLGYQVPTDSPDQVETQDERIQDSIDKVQMHHLYIPFVIFFWLCVFSLFVYWGIARILGNENPIGDIELGAHLGNDAWNDTVTGAGPTSGVLLNSTGLASQANVTGSANITSAILTASVNGTATAAALATPTSLLSKNVPGLRFR